MTERTRERQIHTPCSWRGTRWSLLTALLLAVIAGLFSSLQPSLAANLPSYTIDANLSYDSGIVTAQETVAYANKNSEALDSLVFTVTPAYYGAFQLERASVNGQEVKASVDNQVMEIPTLQRVPPGSTVVATLDFTVTVPVRGGRFGRGPQVIALGNWFPILEVYRDGRLAADGQESGWVRGKYVEIGDSFFSEMSDFSVTLHTDQPVQVAHTGDLVSQGNNTWKFEAKDVRDFAMAISTSFASVSSKVDGIDITVYYLPGHQAAANSYLQAASDTVTWLNQAVTPYPYKHLDEAEINAEGSTTVGQEYPNLVFLADNIANTAGGIDSYGSTLASHETAHQWFYGLIGNDQLYEPWLDEAMVTWLSYHRIQMEDPGSFDSIWQSRVATPGIPNLPVNAGIYTYADEGPYLALVYQRGAIFLQELYQTMGDQAFFAALKDYGSAMAGHISTPYALLDTMQAHTDVNLNPIIARYFSYSRYKAAEPLRVSVTYPEQPWSGAVKLSMDSNAPLQDVQVFIDDSLYMRALPSQLTIDTGQLGEGPHLLTLRANDGERETDIISTFTVKRPTPTPTPLPTPPGRSAEATVETPEVQTAAPTVIAAQTAAPASNEESRLAGVFLVTLSIGILGWALASKNNAGR